MNKLSKEKKQQLGLVIGGTVVLLGLLGNFGIKPLLAHQKEMKDNIENARQALAMAQRTVQNAPQTHDDLQAISARLQAIEEKMISGDTNVWIRTAVINFKSTGFYKVEIPSFSTAEDAKVGVFPEFPYKAAKYRVSGTAYFHDLGRFISDFENYFSYVRVQNIDLSPVDIALSDDKEKLSFTMDLVALIKPPAPKAP